MIVFLIIPPKFDFGLPEVKLRRRNQLFYPQERKIDIAASYFI